MTTRVTEKVSLIRFPEVSFRLTLVERDLISTAAIAIVNASNTLANHLKMSFAKRVVKCFRRRVSAASQAGQALLAGREYSSLSLFPWRRDLPDQAS